MKKSLVLTTLLLTVASLGMAQTTETLQNAKTSYNNNTDQLPGFLTTIVGGERINVEINESGNVTEIGIIMEGVKADKVRKGGVEKPTVKANVNRETIREISESEQPFKNTVDAVKSGEIEYSATTTKSKAKIAVVDFFTGVIDLVL